MAQRNPQTQAKRARELALRERRERKQAKKADAAAAKRAGEMPDDEAPATEDEALATETGPDGLDS